MARQTPTTDNDENENGRSSTGSDQDQRVPQMYARSDQLAAVLNDSSIHGVRLVAKRPFNSGELILPLLGKLTTQSYRTIQIDISTHLKGPLIAFMNHSCSPTAIVDAQTLQLVAARELRIGEEITFFYPSTEWKMVRPFQCLCDAPNCISYVAGAKYLSSDILKQYFINPHIRKLAAIAARPGCGLANCRQSRSSYARSPSVTSRCRS